MEGAHSRILQETMEVIDKYAKEDERLNERFKEEMKGHLSRLARLEQHVATTLMSTESTKGQHHNEIRNLSMQISQCFALVQEKWRRYS